MLFPITSSQYAKDFKRIVQSPKFNHSEYLVVLSLLIAGKPLPAKYSNHPLSGPYKNFLGLSYYEWLRTYLPYH